MDRNLRSPMMAQVYRDDENGTVGGDQAPLLPSLEYQPRWAKKSKRSKGARFLIAFGAFATIYLLFCSWFAYTRWEMLASDEDFAEDGPPHRLPWPFPRHPPQHPPHHPKPHPPHRRPHFFPRPTVLACAPIPTPSAVVALETVELNVTLPPYKGVVLHDHLLHGNVSVVKAPHAEDATAMTGNKTLEVAITVANRTWHHPPPPHSVVPGEEKEDEGFLLCAITFGPPHHKPKPPPEEIEAEDPVHPPVHHPHHPPHPVIVTILPALNSTYPKLPGHHCPHHPPPGAPPPPGGPGEDPDSEPPRQPLPGSPEEGPHEPPRLSTMGRVWRSTISFLFPLLAVSESPAHPQHPFPPHHHAPPPPPFQVTSLTVSVSHFVPVKYGLPFRFPFHHHPPHGRH